MVNRTSPTFFARANARIFGTKIWISTKRVEKEEEGITFKDYKKKYKMNDEEFAKTLLATGVSCQDELWRLPLWSDYRRQIKGKTADLTNSAESGFGGAITAALFLQEFVEPTTSWAHIDLMAWNTTTRPGRPEGGEAMGLRAVYQAILVWIGRKMLHGSSML